MKMSPLQRLHAMLDEVARIDDPVERWKKFREVFNGNPYSILRGVEADERNFVIDAYPQSVPVSQVSRETGIRQNLVHQRRLNLRGG
jgi:hypothetical protein